MTLSANATARLLVLAMEGKPAKARAYLGTMLPRSTPCAEIRAMLAEEFTVAAMTFLDAALPWLAEETLDARPSVTASENGDARLILDAAGPNGVARSNLDPDQLAKIAENDELAEFDQPTGGRPRKMVRLKIHDVRYNPYARQA